MTGDLDRQEHGGCWFMVGRSGGPSAPPSPRRLPAGVNLAVPVLAATGGAGRSTVAGLLAAGLLACAPTVLIDTGEPLSSPWPAWIDEPGAGLAVLPAPEYAPGEAIRAAASTWLISAGQPVPVLCDTRGPDAVPMPRAAGPGVWCQVIVAGGWQIGVLDIGLPAGPQLLTAKYLARRPAVVSWLTTPGVVPALCCPTSGPVLQAIAAVLDLVDEAGWDTQQFVLVLVDVAAGRPPGKVTAAASLLRPRVGALIRLAYDTRIRAAGLQEFGRVSARTHDVCAELAAAVMGRADRLAAGRTTATGRPASSADQPSVLTPRRAGLLGEVGQ